MWIFILTFSLKSPNKKRNKKHSFNDNLNYLKIWRKKIFQSRGSHDTATGTKFTCLSSKKKKIKN